jgi:hypothetical protein
VTPEGREIVVPVERTLLPVHIIQFRFARATLFKLTPFEVPPGTSVDAVHVDV